MMARGGYVSCEVALDKLFSVKGDRHEAGRVVEEALRSHALKARGQRETRTSRSTSDGDGGMVLRNIGSEPDDDIALADPASIPDLFWKNAQLWLNSSWAIGNLGKESDVSFANVTLREQDINALCALLRPETKAVPTSQRTIRSDWSDWAAALASLAHEHRINGHMSQTALRDAITDKFEEWGLSSLGKPPSTVAPVLRRVLERFLTNPPGEPRSGKP